MSNDKKIVVVDEDEKVIIPVEKVLTQFGKTCWEKY
jgi:hypothetical protein